MDEPEFSWHCHRRASPVQVVSTIVAILIYPSVFVYRKLKKRMVPHLPRWWKACVRRVQTGAERRIYLHFFNVKSMSHFDLETQNYAQMQSEVLTKMQAILKPRAKNPKTNWDKQYAQTHVNAIKNELRSRKLQTQF